MNYFDIAYLNELGQQVSASKTLASLVVEDEEDPKQPKKRHDWPITVG